MALASSNGMAVGTVAPPFSLPGVDGQTWSLESFADAKVLVVVFTCNHCPYAVAAEERLVALQADLESRGVRLVAINANDATRYPSDSFENMGARATERGFNFPYVFDESQEVARAYDAACTPDVFVFDGDRALVYNGRIDDNWRSFDQVQHHDLRDVIEATLDGRAHNVDVHAAMGCSIKWKA